MKTKMKNTSRRNAFTLVETLIAIGLFGIVSAICLGSYVSLQRGFADNITLVDLNNKLTRAMGSIETDLRNATGITIDNTATPFPKLTLTVPGAYARYYTSGVRAGDPLDSYKTSLVSGTLRYTGTLSNFTGSVAFQGPAITIEYSGSPDGNPYYGTLSLFRKVTFNGVTAVKPIATFSSGAAISYQTITTGSDGNLNYSGTLSGVKSLPTSVSAVAVTVSGTSDSIRNPYSSGALTRVVSLRALGLK